MSMQIYKSPFLLALKIIALEVLIEFVYLIIGILIQVSAEMLGYELRLISVFTQLLLLPVQIGILVFMLAKWSSETYEIHDEELVIRSGILKREERSYPYKNMQSVIVRQSILDGIAGAGTVSVFVPTLGTDLIFSEVPNPKRFAEHIKKSIPNLGAHQFILKR